MKIGSSRVHRVGKRDAAEVEYVMAKDPVCGMTIDEKTAAGQSNYQGKTYYFCATVCKRKFDEDPAKYAARS